MAPAPPTGLAVAYGATNVLSRNASFDDDFSFYRVYRGSDPDFVPGPQTLVHETTATGWA